MRGRWLRTMSLMAFTMLLVVWVNRPSTDTPVHVSDLMGAVRQGWYNEEDAHQVEAAQPAPVESEERKEEEVVEDVKLDPEPVKPAATEDPLAAVPFCSNEDRVDHLKETCGGSIGSLADVPVQLRMPLYNNMFVDTKHELLACLPPKSGCTTWKNILANNSGDNPLPKDFNMMKLHFGDLPKFGIKTLSAFNESQRQYFFDNYYKIMVARHPFERFRSAYIDKLESGKDRYMQLQYGIPILQKFHPEFPQGRINDGKGVTLSEFTNFIRLTNTMNPHWKKVYDLCLPCHIKYDRILKTETLDHDNEFVIMHKMAPYFRGLGTKGNIVAGGTQTASLSRHGRLLDRFDNATLADLSFLEKFYKEDFQHFGYTWNYRQGEDGSYHVHSSCVNGGEGGACC